MAEQLSDVLIAQKRIMANQARRNYLIAWTLIALALSGLTLYSPWLALYTLPALFVAVTLATINYARGVHSSFKQMPREHILEYEMMWLYGDDWQANADPVHLAFAKNRIRQRQLARWSFIVHSPIFTLGSISLIVSALLKTSEPSVNGALIPIFLVWAAIFFVHALTAWPTNLMIERRERAVGRALQAEMRALYVGKIKNDEKLKHGLVRLSDDGELIDVADTYSVAPERAEDESANAKDLR